MNYSDWIFFAKMFAVLKNVVYLQRRFRASGFGDSGWRESIRLLFVYKFQTIRVSNCFNKESGSYDKCFFYRVEEPSSILIQKVA